MPSLLSRYTEQSKKPSLLSRYVSEKPDSQDLSDISVGDTGELIRNSRFLKNHPLSESYFKFDVGKPEAVSTAVQVELERLPVSKPSAIIPPEERATMEPQPPEAELARKRLIKTPEQEKEVVRRELGDEIQTAIETGFRRTYGFGLIPETETEQKATFRQPGATTVGEVVGMAPIPGVVEAGIAGGKVGLKLIGKLAAKYARAATVAEKTGVLGELVAEVRKIKPEASEEVVKKYVDDLQASLGDVIPKTAELKEPIVAPEQLSALKEKFAARSLEQQGIKPRHAKIEPPAEPHPASVEPLKPTEVAPVPPELEIGAAELPVSRETIPKVPVPEEVIAKQGAESVELGAGLTPKALAQSIENLGNSKVIDEIKTYLAPATRGIQARETAAIFRHNIATMRHSADKAEKSLETARTFFDKQPDAIKFDFIDRIEEGTEQVNPKLQPFANVLRTGLDERRDAIRALGTGKLENFIENYFPHIWEKPDKAKTFYSQWFTRRPLEGSKSFLKKRTIPTMKEGLEAGLTPVSKNPVDLTLLKMAEMDKYLMAHKSLGEMKEKGLLQFVRSGHKAPDGWVKINDRVSTVYYKTEKKELVQAGNYYAPEPAARIVNNYLSPGLRQGSKLFSIYRNTGNLLNQAQLGLSAFHLGFTSLDAATSKVALAINKIARGEVLGAVRDIVASPIAPVTNIWRGNKLYKEWFSPGTQGEKIGKYIQALESGGGRPRMDSFYQTKITQKMIRAWREGNPIGVAIRLPGSVLEQTARPIMEYLVPRQKLGVFMDLAKMELKRNPNMTLDEQRTVIAKIWDSVDNRMGQLVYDNVFWNGITKDLAMASIRSVGWNLGTIREVAGGALDIGKAGLKVLQWEKPEMTYRMAYTLALPIVTGTLGAIIQYLMTGEKPTDLKDLYFPRTGETDENGDPQRVSLPSYMKDIYHYATAPGKTMTNKLHPSISLIADMLKNRDFYGTEIRNEDDPWMKQVLDLAKHVGKGFEPLAARNIERQYKVEGGVSLKTVLPFVGITPAPRDVNATKAEKLAYEYVRELMPRGTRTSKQAEESQLKYEIRRDIKKGKTMSPMSLIEAKKAGKLTEREIGNLRTSATQTPLQRAILRLPLDQAIKVFDAATDGEKKEIEKIMKRKIHNFSANASKEDKKLLGSEVERIRKLLIERSTR